MILKLFRIKYAIIYIKLYNVGLARLINKITRGRLLFGGVFTYSRKE